MSTTSVIIVSAELVPYILAWKYIRHLVRDVNARGAANKVSIWRWHEGWRMHSQFFPASSVRLCIVTCIVLSAALGLVAVWIEVRNFLIHR